MRKTAAFLVMLQVLGGCQGTHAPAPAYRRNEENRALEDPAIAASIMAELAGDLVTILPEGARLSLVADQPKVLSDALRQALVEHGHEIAGSQTAVQGAIPLQTWGAQIDGELLIRISTPSHRLARVYRLAAPPGNEGPGAARPPAVIPAGPLLVETIPQGARS